MLTQLRLNAVMSFSTNSKIQTSKREETQKRDFKGGLRDVEHHVLKNWMAQA